MASPATEVVDLLVKRQKSKKWRERISTFPEDEIGYREALAEHLASDDWYSGVSHDEASRVEDIVAGIFGWSGDKLKLWLKLKYDKRFRDVNFGDLELISTIWSGARLLPESQSNESLTLDDFDQSERPVMYGILLDTDTLPSFCHAPFRHPDFDLVTAAKAYAEDGAYMPGYAVHSPENTARIFEAIEEAAPRLLNLEEPYRIEFEFLREVFSKTVEKQGGLSVVLY